MAERPSGVTTETEITCIERDEQISLAEFMLRLEESKRLMAALQADIVPAQMTALNERRRGCELSDFRSIVC